MKQRYDYLIIGAGPAGMAAAITAHRLGLSVAVVDEQQIPGGQIYRAIERQDTKALALLGRDYRHGGKLVADFRQSGVDYLPRATVWQVTPENNVFFLNDGKSAGQVAAGRILIATGAQERPVTFPGWTLPGVIGAGAVDVLFKTSAMLPDGKIVMAGSGPLLYLVACHLIEAGRQIAAILDTRSLKDYIQAARLLPSALSAPRYLLRGLAMHALIRRRRVPYFSAVTKLKASGAGHVSTVTFRSGRQRHRLAADHLIVHDGVVPNTQVTRQLEVKHVWDPIQRYWKPQCDRWGATSIAGIAVCGDSGGIYGAKAAELAGSLAALAAAHGLGCINRTKRDHKAAPLWARYHRETAVRPFLDGLFRPHPEFYAPPDDETIVCRCEEVTAGQIRQAAAVGGVGPNQVKSQIRCGMGPCQGRFCGLTVSEIIAAEHNTDVPRVGYYRIRPPLKPIPLHALANLEISEPGP